MEEIRIEGIDNEVVADVIEGANDFVEEAVPELAEVASVITEEASNVPDVTVNIVSVHETTDTLKGMALGGAIAVGGILLVRGLGKLIKKVSDKKAKSEPKKNGLFGFAKREDEASKSEDSVDKTDETK